MQYIKLALFVIFLTVFYYCIFLYQENFIINLYPSSKTSVENSTVINHSVYQPVLFHYNRHHFNCAAIISGNLAEIRRAERFVDVPLMSTNWSKLLLHTQCENLVYDFYPSTMDEKEFPMAFGLIVYKNPAQLLKLFRTIYRPWNYYCIHLDSKSRSMEPLVEKLQYCFPNFRSADIRENIKWGEISLLKGALHCMTQMYNTFNNWKYYLNIAGSDFPLKTNSEIVAYLKGLNNFSDVQDLADDDAWKYKYSFKGGISKKALDELKSALKTGQYYPTKPPVPANLHIHKGSFSGTFHKNFVEFLIKNETSLKLLNWLEDTFIPDEAYWSTLFHGYYKIMISSNSTDFSTRYTHWGDSKPRCSGYNEHGLCVYGLYDLRWLVKKPYLFAHKFDEKLQPITIDCLESFIRNKSLKNTL